MTDQRAHLRVRVFRTSEFHFLGLFLQRRDEFVENRTFHVNPLRAQADLPAIREHGPDGAFDRGVEIGVGKDDGRVLAAKFEGQRLHVLGCRAHDRAAGCRLAGKGDRADAGVGCHELARRTRSETVNHVERAVRHAGLFHHFREQGGGRRGFFGRFQDNRVARCHSRRDFPGREQQRQVPRADHADHPMRVADRIVDRPGAVRRVLLVGFGADRFDEICKDPEIRRAARDIDMARERARLAGIEGFGFDELV